MNNYTLLNLPSATPPPTSNPRAPIQQLTAVFPCLGFCCAHCLRFPSPLVDQPFETQLESQFFHCVSWRDPAAFSLNPHCLCLQAGVKPGISWPCCSYLSRCAVFSPLEVAGHHRHICNRKDLVALPVLLIVGGHRGLTEKLENSGLAYQ